MKIRIRYKQEMHCPGCKKVRMTGIVEISRKGKPLAGYSRCEECLKRELPLIWDILSEDFHSAVVPVHESDERLSDSEAGALVALLKTK